MKLYDRQFVRRVRRRVRAEVKANKRWKAERRSTRAPRHYAMGALLRPVLPLAAMAVAYGMPASDAVLAALLAWTMALVLYRASLIQNLLLARTGIVPFLQFPVSKEFALDYVERSVLRSSLWVAADAAGVFAGLILHFGRGNWPGVIAGAALVWAAALSTSMVLLWRAPAFPYQAISNLLWAFLGIGWALVAKWAPLDAEAVHASYHAARWWLPTGWALVTTEWLTFGRPAAPLAPTLLLLGLVTLGVFGRRALRERFHLWEPAGNEIADGGEPEPVVRVSEVEDEVRARDFLAMQAWRARGFVERIAEKFLSPRERRVADLLLIQPPRWSHRYQLGAFLVASAPLAASFLPRESSAGAWVLILGVGVGLVIVTPLFGGVWAGFATAPVGHRVAAFFTLWPVTVREVRGCILKINFVRLLGALPWWLYAGGGVAWFIGRPIAPGAVLGAKAWLICLLLQPFFVVIKVSAGTNDTSSGCLFVAGLFAFGFGVLASTAAAASFSLATGKTLWWLGATVALGLLSWGFEATYRRAWRSQRFDLLAKPDPRRRAG